MLAVLRSHGAADACISSKYYPTAKSYRARLEQHGFEVCAIEIIPRPTLLPTGIEGWLETFGVTFFERLPPSKRAEARREVIELLSPSLLDDAGFWTADYVRLRFSARLPAA